MDSQLQTMIDNMPEKTGKSLEEWLNILSGKTFQKHSEAVNFLKKEHGVSHGFANTIVHLSKSDTSEEMDLVDAQYQGNENLKPMYEEIKKIISDYGSDVEFAPKKAYVSVRRKKQFAIIQPSTKSRLDIGINLKNAEPHGDLLTSGSFNAMVSHRVKIESPESINENLKSWLRQAYDEAG